MARLRSIESAKRIRRKVQEKKAKRAELKAVIMNKTVAPRSVLLRS